VNESIRNAEKIRTDSFADPANLSRHLPTPWSWRAFGNNTRAPYDTEVDRINERFAEAREEIEIAKEDAESVYFNESCESARAAVKEVLDSWTALIESLGPDDKARLQRSMGLKMEQLKAEVKGLDELHA